MDKEEEFNFATFLMKNCLDSKAQLFQDLWVQWELGWKRNGYFVEFGICGGMDISNSYILEKNFGWRGVVAEPNSGWHAELFKNRNCFISTKCVFTKTGETVEFNKTGWAEISTINAYSAVDHHAGNRAGGTIDLVETVRLRDLLEQAGAPRCIDYLSIDTEGSEYDILSDFDFDEYSFRLITVEHNWTGQREQIHKLLTSKGYRRKFEFFSKFDDWYVRDRSVFND
jgi:FkbM family methyltransferase